MLSNHSVLFAEDDDPTRENMAQILSFMTQTTYVAKDGEEALSLYKEKKPDVVIMDIEMPQINGLDVAKEIRKIDKNIPIVIITAYKKTEYFLQAIELNLTTFILKPIMIDNLKEALVKCVDHLHYSEKKKIFISNNVYYDVDLRILLNDGKEQKLKHIEMNFLEYLLKNPNRVISYEEFERNIWEEGMTTGAIRSLVRDIRKILPENVIVNVAKVGYKLLLEVQ